MDQENLAGTSKEHLVDKVVRILKTGTDLDFLLELRQKDLEILAACLRDLTEQEGNERDQLAKNRSGNEPASKTKKVKHEPSFVRMEAFPERVR